MCMKVSGKGRGARSTNGMVNMQDLTRETSIGLTLLYI